MESRQGRRALTGARIESLPVVVLRNSPDRRALTGARIESARGSTRRDTVPVAPSRARELKDQQECRPRAEHDGRALTGARIERFSAMFSGAVRRCRALTGARIERSPRCAPCTEASVAPSRARELKAGRSSPPASRRRVAPSRAREFNWADLLAVMNFCCSSVFCGSFAFHPIGRCGMVASRVSYDYERSLAAARLA